MFDWLSVAFDFMRNTSLYGINLLTIAIVVLVITGLGILIRGNK